jgi:hypothetical protein
MKAIEKIKQTVNGLTDFEKTCFDYFAFNYQSLAGNLEDNANWVDFADCTEKIPAKQLRGVFSSLEKKELIFFAECDETTYYITGLAVACWFYMNDKEEFDKCSAEVLEQYI